MVVITGRGHFGRGPDGEGAAPWTRTPYGRPGPGDVEPLGPGSLTWKYFGDWRGVLLAPWAGAMQNMHPGLGAGVAEHSRFFEERWQRLFRSLYPIGGVVYDGPRAAETGTSGARLPQHDQGRGPARTSVPRARSGHLLLGARHVLHAHPHRRRPFRAGAERGGEAAALRRTRALVAAVRDDHAARTARVGPTSRRTGTAWPPRCWRTTGPPATCSTSATSRSRRRSRWLPDFVWRAIRGPQARFTVWFTVGLFPGAVRERLGYSWTVRDERRLRRIGRLVHHAWRLVPFRYRYHPRARAGWEREAGLRAPDAPQVESPVRNLPLPDELDSPKHYVPPGA